MGTRAGRQYGMTDRIPLLLLPGLLNDAELWRAQIADLSDIAECIVGDQTDRKSVV